MNIFGLKPWHMLALSAGGFLAMSYGIRPFFQIVVWLGAW